MPTLALLPLCASPGWVFVYGQNVRNYELENPKNKKKKEEEEEEEEEKEEGKFLHAELAFPDRPTF